MSEAPRARSRRRASTLGLDTRCNTLGSVPDASVRASHISETGDAVTRQAAMVAYVDAFWFLFLVTLAAIPLLLLLRKPARKPEAEMQVHLDYSKRAGE